MQRGYKEEEMDDDDDDDDCYDEDGISPSGFRQAVFSLCDRLAVLLQSAVRTTRYSQTGPTEGHYASSDCPTVPGPLP